MKPVGKPDAGKLHVRFDERGRETERLAKPQATAPFLDSTATQRGAEKSWFARVLRVQYSDDRRVSASPAVRLRLGSILFAG